MDNTCNRIVQHAKSLFTLGITVLVNSSATSMSPSKLNATLPQLTKAKFIQQTQVEQAIESNDCKYLVKGRKYTAPIGFTNKGGMKNGAHGIDEWVALDGGNL